MNTPTYYAGMYFENDRAAFERYRGAVEAMMAAGVDPDEIPRRIALQMKEELASAEAVAEQTRNLAAPYDDILKSALAFIDWGSVARGFMNL